VVLRVGVSDKRPHRTEVVIHASLEDVVILRRGVTLRKNLIREPGPEAVILVRATDRGVVAFRAEAWFFRFDSERIRAGYGETRDGTDTRGDRVIRGKPDIREDVPAARLRPAALKRFHRAHQVKFTHRG